MRDGRKVNMRSRSQSLEFALLGFLLQGPLHGYELRRRLTAIYGPFRALSFSVLYPQLRRMVIAGLIEEKIGTAKGRSRRVRIVYVVTAKGEKQFNKATEIAGPDSWEDEGFEVRFAFFTPTPAANRLRILEGRLRRLRAKSEVLHEEIDYGSVGLDKYLIEWRRHSLESVDREITWLEEMITTERKSK